MQDAALFRNVGRSAALLCRAGFNSSLMPVSAALGRVAGQGFYGVAQAAFYRFEALLYSAAASGEGYGEGAARYYGDGTRKEGTARVFERLDAHHFAEAGDDFVGYRKERLGRVVAL